MINTSQLNAEAHILEANAPIFRECIGKTNMHQRPQRKVSIYLANAWMIAKKNVVFIMSWNITHRDTTLAKEYLRRFFFCNIPRLRPVHRINDKESSFAVSVSRSPFIMGREGWIRNA